MSCCESCAKNKPCEADCDENMNFDTTEAPPVGGETVRLQSQAVPRPQARAKTAEAGLNLQARMARWLRGGTFAFLLAFVASCAGLPRADVPVLWTETGLRAASDTYHDVYMAKLEECASEAAPATPEAQECFGEWAKTDALVNDILAAAVSTLRAYWIARAAGERPDWAQTMADVTQLIGSMPTLARGYFERVKGTE